MSGLDTSQELTDAASLKDEKLKNHPHLEGHPHAGGDDATPDEVAAAPDDQPTGSPGSG